MSGENTTVDSVNKMHDVLMEVQQRRVSHLADANLERAQRMAYGQYYRESDVPAVGEEMVAVDSTITTNHYHGTQPPENKGGGHPASTPAIPGIPAAITGIAGRPGLSTLAKLGIGAALIASGAGAGAGIGMVLSGAKDIAKPALQSGGDVSVPQPPVWMLELGKPRDE